MLYKPFDRDFNLKVILKGKTWIYVTPIREWPEEITILGDRAQVSPSQWLLVAWA